MARQRLRQDKLGAELRLGDDDLLIAGETPCFDGKKLRVVRMRVAQDGYAEVAAQDIACLPRSFWHWSDFLPQERVEELRRLLAAAKAALGLKIDKDPNGHYRLIDCRLGGRRKVLKMLYTKGVPQHDVPAFEAAWAAVVGLFPKAPV